MSLRPQNSESTEESDKSDTKNRKGETQAGHQMEKTEEKFSTKSTLLEMQSPVITPSL